MPIRNIPNEVALQTTLIGTEAQAGVAVVPDGRLLIPFTAQPGIGAIQRGRDATGTYDRTASFKRDSADPSGTFGGAFTFQEMAILGRYAMKGGVTGTTDANTVPATTYAYAPSANVDDIDTFTAYFGVDGLPWVSTGTRFDEINISGDATGTDASWQVSGTPFMKDVDRLETGDAEFVATGGTTATVVNTGAGWTVDQFEGAYIFKAYGSHIGEVRMVDTNTADTITVETPWDVAPVAGDVFYISAEFPVVPRAQYDTIPMEGTRVYLDPYNASASAIGTTLISDRVLSFNVRQVINLARKKRASGTIGRLGRGQRDVDGAIRLELDRWDEYVALKNLDALSLRIEQDGPPIDATAGTTHMARIDVERIAFDTWTPDEDNNNMTVSLAFVAGEESPIWDWTVTTDLAVLP